MTDALEPVWYVCKPSKLPTAVREEFAQQKQLEAARLLEALYMQGHKPGEIITKDEAKDIGAEYGISAKAVEKGLKARIAALLGETRPVFQLGISPPLFPLVNLHNKDETDVNWST